MLAHLKGGLLVDLGEGTVFPSYKKNVGICVMGHLKAIKTSIQRGQIIWGFGSGAKNGPNV